MHTCSGEIHLGALRSAAVQGEDAAQSETHPHLQEERRHPAAINRDRDLHILKDLHVFLKKKKIYMKNFVSFCFQLPADGRFLTFFELSVCDTLNMFGM